MKKNAASVATEFLRSRGLPIPQRLKRAAAPAITAADSTVDDEKKRPRVVDVASLGPCVRWPWVQGTDPATGRDFYYNSLTEEASWILPDSPVNSPSHPKEEVSTSVGTEATVSPKAAPLPESVDLAASPPEPPPAAEDEERDVRDALAAAAAKLIGEFQEVAGVVDENADNDESRVGAKAAKSIFVEHYRTPTKAELLRPARVQAVEPVWDRLGYEQGSECLNIWYGKVEGTDWRDKDMPREKALTRCNPFLDSGWTKANDMDPENRPVICIYYARGCCYRGVDCEYLHRVPTVDDDAKLDDLHDIFGRTRFSSHRDDMSGVGTFQDDCRMLYVGDLKVHRHYDDPEPVTEKLLHQGFSVWGPIESIRTVQKRNMAFVTYKYRAHAEFAKVAMAEQRLMLDVDDDQVNVRWAFTTPRYMNEDTGAERDKRDQRRAEAAVAARQAALYSRFLKQTAPKT